MRLTEFSCPTKAYARCVVSGGQVVFPELVNHLELSIPAGSGYCGFDFTPTNTSGLYLVEQVTPYSMDLTCGSISYLGAGSLYVLGLK